MQGGAHVVVRVRGQVGERVQRGRAVQRGGRHLYRGRGGQGEGELEKAGVLHRRRHLCLEADRDLRAVGGDVGVQVVQGGLLLQRSHLVRKKSNCRCGGTSLQTSV